MLAMFTLFLGLAIQEDPDSSTKGDPANADDKLRPAKIRGWMGFSQEQEAIWEDLMGIDFVTQRHFVPLIVLKRYGEDVRQSMLSSELDLGYFEHFTIESVLPILSRNSMQARKSENSFALREM
ncbi:unnamed protein product [Penicillium egyptiacum]|uniref:Uncharacterized protein n=1 Tax=Penicillium egyptiacum TaxID=1303716 RepID=A0A9W4KHS3_9EURO|nr:unnamed protein product [Penicillium egyptiacum]